VALPVFGLGQNTRFAVLDTVRCVTRVSKPAVTSRITVAASLRADHSRSFRLSILLLLYSVANAIPHFFCPPAVVGGLTREVPAHHERHHGRSAVSDAVFRRHRCPTATKTTCSCARSTGSTRSVLGEESDLKPMHWCSGQLPHVCWNWLAPEARSTRRGIGAGRAGACRRSSEVPVCDGSPLSGPQTLAAVRLGFGGLAAKSGVALLSTI